jgi:hypothetical protein
MEDVSIMSQDSVTQVEAAKLLLDEWKFRHQHLWDSLRRYGLAAVIVSIVPYVKPDLVTRLDIYVMVFPVVGYLVSLAAIWLFAAEYYRLRPVAARHRELLRPYYPEKREDVSGWKKSLTKKIGWATVYILSSAFTALFILNVVLLWQLQRNLVSSMGK